jgi:hypothetical protein
MSAPIKPAKSSGHNQQSVNGQKIAEAYDFADETCLSEPRQHLLPFAFGLGIVFFCLLHC